MPHWTQFLQPAVAGLIIGFIGYIGFPQVMGAGYEYMDQAMHGQYTWEILGILAGLKILSTSISFVRHSRAQCRGASCWSTSGGTLRCCRRARSTSTWHRCDRSWSDTQPSRSTS